jgi:succinyl-diaminopimelate desuccinylase
VEVSAAAILDRMVRLPSVTGDEGALAGTLAAWCGEAGMEVEFQEVSPGRPNLIARWRVGRRPATVLTGHLDTVPVVSGWSHDPFGADVVDGRLIGLGASDMKGGLAAMVAALLSIRARGREPRGDVVLAATVGEEEDSAGTRQLLGQGLEADGAVLAEPTGLALVTSNRGLRNFRLRVRGAPAHASAPALGRNAIVAAARVVLELEAVGARLARCRHPDFGPPTLTVGTIRGGTRPYVVPDLCEIEVDRRVNPDEAPEGVRGQIEQALDSVRPLGVEVELEEGPDYLPFEIPEGDDLVRRMATALRSAGLRRRRSAWRAASDAGLFVHNAGIPCVLFGPGSLDAAHRPDEWIDLAQLEAAQYVFEHLLLGT